MEVWQIKLKALNHNTREAKEKCALLLVWAGLFSSYNEEELKYHLSPA